LNTSFKNTLLSWAWWHTHVILALRRLRQEDCEFQANLSCRARPWVKKISKETNKKAFVPYSYLMKALSEGIHLLA
jgi:hypothetical protein